MSGRERAVIVGVAVVITGLLHAWLVSAGHPEAVWLYCDMLGWC